MTTSSFPIPVLDLSASKDPNRRPRLLQQLRSALFDIGFLYIVNHDIPHSVITNLTDHLPRLFTLPSEEKARLSKSHSPHFLGYSGYAEETTLGKKDLREQFDFATELPVVYRGNQPASTYGDHEAAGSISNTSDRSSDQAERDFTKLYWRLRGPNQFPSDEVVPGFRKAFLDYHDAVQELSYHFVHLIEEAFGIPVGTFDHFFGRHVLGKETSKVGKDIAFLPPQHRIKLLRYPPANSEAGSAQGVGPHKDSSGWLTFLYQVGNEPGLEVQSPTGDWLPARPIDGSFVVNFGNAFEAATEGAVKATIHRVLAPGPTSNVRYSIPFFQGLPLDMTVSEVRSYIPEKVRSLRKASDKRDNGISSFLDPRWDELGESQLRKWIRSHKEVGLQWYGSEVVDYYTEPESTAQNPTPRVVV